MQIDCETCPVRERQCAECMVTALLELAPLEQRLDDDERHAVDTLAAAGLITAQEATSATARIEPWDPLRSTG
ncbi:hypothetical protein HJ588_11160 [Flexivirga sp. ID2601S]|uniref:Uncharacterized protein n=1 Tax=Flexivirga aerilata TaxID=1656889 RepID=A0A849ANB0_9MICO|nr:hypothetical protein [Flexivirga aerilata]NNG39830.1 hypothetical protein [Flexivirga aerilata]